MKRILIAFTITGAILTGCEEKCIQHIYSSTVVVDVSDTIIANQFKREAPAIVEKLAPAKLNRCEGVQVSIEAIGATIENQSATISFPVNRTLSYSIGNYAISDSNTAKNPALVKGLINALDGFQAIGNNQSQIFYTLTQILNNKKGKVIIYTDLLEFYGEVSFYKSKFDFEKTFLTLLDQYSMDSVQSRFTGSITIVSPMEKNQDKILKAREFFKFYFSKIGIVPSQYEFVGSITKSKF